MRSHSTALAVSVAPSHQKRPNTRSGRRERVMSRNRHQVHNPRMNYAEALANWVRVDKSTTVSGIKTAALSPSSLIPVDCPDKPIPGEQ